MVESMKFWFAGELVTLTVIMQPGPSQGPKN